VGETREQRLLFSIVVMLFAILVTLVGGGIVGLLIGLAALFIGSTVPRLRS